MKRIFLAVVLLGFVLMDFNAQAGDPDRAGQAGATQLLINPWARSSGIGGLNNASIKGIESTFLNVAGLAFTEQTEVIFSRTNYLQGADIFINSLGLSQKVGASGVLGLSIMSMDLGDIPITTEDQPDGTLGTFSPTFLNVGVAYSKKFSNSIYGGMLLRVISESIADVNAGGVAVDAGVQYHTSFNNAVRKLKGDDFHFGISLRNIGPDMSYGGPGLSVTTFDPRNNGFASTTEQRSEAFNLPSLIHIGAAYDFRLDKIEGAYFHRLSLVGNFTSNTFSNNQYGLGLEYGFKNILMLRGGYNYERDIFDEEKRTTFFTGISAGFTVEFPIGKSGTTFGVDYSYRDTQPFNGVHTFGARINLGSNSGS